METFRSGLVPPNNLSLNISSTHSRFNILPPKFNFNASTAGNLAFHQPGVAIRRNPQALSVATLETAKDCNNSPILKPNSDSDDCFSLFNLFRMKNGSYYDCKQLHGQYVKSGGWGSKSLMGNQLAILYSKGEASLDDARKLFDEIPDRTISAYAALIGSYSRSERWEELFAVFRLMVRDGILPNKYLLPTILKACSAVQLLRSGKMVHGYVVRNESETDVFVGNGLIDLYANCGEFRYSKNVFDSMQERDVVSWTALLSAYMDGGLLEEATDIFHSMQVNGVKLDLISWNTLVSGFARNGNIDLAFQYLEEMQEQGVKPQVTSWNGIISGFVQNGFYEDALDTFNRMVCFPENPNVVTLVSILPACAGTKDLNLGRAIHGYSIKRKFQGNIHVAGSLIDMYLKCGRNDYAEKEFIQVEDKNTALWNEMIAAYVDEGKMDAALALLRSMQNDGLRPDEITYNTILAGHARHGRKNEAYDLLSEMTKMALMPNIVSFNVLISGFQQSGLSYEALRLFQTMQSPSSNFCVELPNVPILPNPVTTTCALAACADLSLLCRGKQIHGYIIRRGFEANVFVSSALVDMYAKCREINSATNIFWKIEDRNTVSWNSLIAGHTSNDQPEEALKLFSAMLAEGFIPSSITFMILLPVARDMEAPKLARALHGYILKSHDIELDNSLASALIDMCAKCGCVADAKLLLDPGTYVRRSSL
ncbi:pentatricopeptide repeat-containing protein At1g19720-like [Diospyros lotus]|uniref:pentatricopeptide repeat-containing protein At1g19720-like n=1 Tax=Diospyros lotus TaxID=55363 RepID=UPI00225A94F0|nr:pentatricopeptide repeat-containing protein At1g19720-like [Diospyros lotus]